MIRLGHDRFNVEAGSTLRVGAPGVRANDSGATAVTLLAEPAHGSLAGLVSGGEFDGGFAYTPAAGFTGTDTFTYKAADGDLDSPEASVLVDVTPAPFRTIVASPQSSRDDAEERSDGWVNLTSSDLELVRESSDQTIGIRFPGVGIPRRARIVEAWIQFTVDETNSEATELELRGVVGGDVSPFSSVSGDVTGRELTAWAVGWSPAAWERVGDSGAAQRTPDIAAVVQEVIELPGWAAGRPMVFVIAGQGRRVAESFDGSAAAAPLLRIEYQDLSGAPASWRDSSKSALVPAHRPRPPRALQLGPELRKRGASALLRAGLGGSDKD